MFFVLLNGRIGMATIMVLFRGFSSFPNHPEYLFLCVYFISVKVFYTVYRTKMLNKLCNIS